MQLTDLVAAQQQIREEAAAGGPEFAAFLKGIRHSTLLVPMDDQGGIWSAEVDGIRWLLAFSDEKLMAAFAKNGSDADLGMRQPGTSEEEGKQIWDHRKVMGWKLLDFVVPAAGRPCGVALDAGTDDGKVLPPVAGIVPDRATADAYAANGGRTRSR
ncbi:SseB family protein [Streptomyces bathyalis]|uniref:SseB family protein n=1 Tax=Streptomyces bathyalis TaxID=2710756 RepID=UPI001FE41478|nr:SseB family protein [Streptomyces bathyalis]